MYKYKNINKWIHFEHADYFNKKLYALYIYEYIKHKYNITIKDKIKKIIKLLFPILFYSITICFILLILGVETFGIRKFLNSLFPITYKSYWFCTAYILIYLFHPFINKLLNNLTKKEHLILNIFMFTIFSVLTTLTTSNYYGNELIQFCFFYSIGAYLKKYPDNFFANRKNCIKIIIISSLIIILSIILFDIINIHKTPLKIRSIYLLSRTSPFTIMISTSLFCLLAYKKTYENKIINFISRLIFGVYLISDNRYLRPIIWKNIFKNKLYINSPYLFLHLIVSVTLIIIVCLLIELIRQLLIENKIFIYIDQIYDKVQEKVKRKTQNSKV